MRLTFKGQERAGGINLVKVNLRLFIWCGGLFLFFCTILFYRIGLEKRWQSLEDEAFTWGVCKVKYELGLGLDTDCPQSKFPHPINYPGTVIHYIVASSLGTLSFFTLGTSSAIYYFWYYIVQLVRQRKWDQLRELLTNEKAFSSMRLQDIRSSRSLPSTGDVKLGSVGDVSRTSTTISSNISADMQEHSTSEKSDVNEDEQI
jgi:hypothetical protein